MRKSINLHRAVTLCSAAAFATTGLTDLTGQGGAAFADEFTSGTTGGGQAHNNHQPGLGINYIVALQGTFPSRSADAGDVTTSSSSPHVGEISMFAGNFAPSGWALADGQLLPIAQNTALFSLFGTIYGGDGRTTFALPDLRGRSAMHYGNGPGLTPRPIGQKGGADTVTLGINQMPSHNHAIPGHEGFPPAAGIDPTSSVGGGQSHNNMKPYQAINFHITTFGTFPSTNANPGTISTSGSDELIGIVQMGGYNFAPRSTSQTNGQLVSIAQNAALFSILGTTYGGDGESTFGLPELRGRIVAGAGNGRSLGQNDGTETETLSLLEMPSHTHPNDLSDTFFADLSSTGGGQAHNNIQPTGTLNYIIATQGVFPSPNADVGDITQNGSEPFLGEINMFAGNFAPRGWMLAQGQLLQISQYQALFSILGTTYGGDGESTFGLPDLRNRVPVHVGNGPGLKSWQLGEVFGENTHTLTVDQLPAHNHTYAVPTPSAALLGLIGLGGLLARRRRREA